MFFFRCFQYLVTAIRNQPFEPRECRVSMVQASSNSPGHGYPEARASTHKPAPYLANWIDSRSDSAASVTHVVHLVRAEMVKPVLKRMETRIRGEGVDLSGVVLVHELLDRLDCEEHRPRRSRSDDRARFRSGFTGPGPLILELRHQYTR